jgi:hypothetical protein
MRLAIGVLACSACATTPATSPGDLQTVSNSGGGLLPCTASTPWCSFDATYSGSAITIASRTTTMKAHGLLTPAAVDELASLIASIPLATAMEEPTGCADAPIITFTIDFDRVGVRTYHRACEFDNLDALHAFVNNVQGALIPQCTGNARVACAQP